MNECTKQPVNELIDQSIAAFVQPRTSAPVPPFRRGFARYGLESSGSTLQQWLPGGSRVPRRVARRHSLGERIDAQARGGIFRATPHPRCTGRIVAGTWRLMEGGDGPAPHSRGERERFVDKPSRGRRALQGWRGRLERARILFVVLFAELENSCCHASL